MGATAVQDLALYLETQGLGTRGTDLFTDTLPDRPDVAVGLLMVPGSPAQYRFGTNAPLWEFPHVAVRVRAARQDAATARAKADAIYRALAQIQAQTINGTFYVRVVPLHAPWKLDEDDAGRPIYAFSVETWKELSV